MDTDSTMRSKITIAHIALARGWINGLDLAALANRYLAPLGGGVYAKVDMRIARTVLTRVLQELANVATRHNIQGSSTLFRQAKRIRTDASGPSLADFKPRLTFEDFVASQPDSDAFSHTELVEIYNDSHPPASEQDKALERQSRLITRQLQLLSRLEKLVSAPVQWSDSVAGWFAAALSERLEAAGFKTIEQLAVSIAGNPASWHVSVPGIGVGKAQRVANYLTSQLGSLEEGLTRQGVHYEVAMWGHAGNMQGHESQLLDLAELDALATVNQDRLPPSSLLAGRQDLDGSGGRLRDRHNASAIEASNDYEAMQTWLSLKRSAVTVKLYEREATRLIAWSVQVRRRPMSSLSIEDAIAYRDFLCAIPPEILIKKGPRARTPQAHQDVNAGKTIAVPGFTKPGLKASTVKKALVIVSGFFAWLVTVRYVTANPFVGVQAISGLVGVGMGSTEAEDEASMERARERRSNVLGRVLPLEAVEAVNRYLDRTPEHKDAAFHARVRFVFKLATMTGLRISEMAAARRDHLEYIEPDATGATEGGWILHVLGKRDKPREVPIPDDLATELECYLAHRGLLNLPSPSLSVAKGTFLIGAYPSHVGPSQALSSDPDQVTLQRSNQFKQAGDGVRAQTIHLALKELFKIAMQAQQFKDDKTAEKMQKASAHWLRHTLATRAVAAGTPVDVVASIFGHASIATTSIYIQAERHRKLSEMRKLWGAQKQVKRNMDGSKAGI